MHFFNKTVITTFHPDVILQFNVSIAVNNFSLTKTFLQYQGLQLDCNLNLEQAVYRILHDMEAIHLIRF